MCLFYQHCSEPIYVVETNKLKQRRENGLSLSILMVELVKNSACLMTQQVMHLCLI